MICAICPHACDIAEGEAGFCHARVCKDGQITSAAYGYITACALDPIEKKPLFHFHPGSMILSIGGFGCNFRCAFCQNHHISMRRPHDLQQATPRQIAALAKDTVSQGNIGVAYTYNEPLINFEFVYDTARLVHAEGLKNVLVTNGFINPAPLAALLPYIDALNIDLKSFSPDFYDQIKGRLSTVTKTIEQAARHAHVEVTTLVIPGENDGESEMDALARFVAGVDKGIPLHLSRFFPRHQMTDKPPTPPETIYRLKEVAEKHLEFVCVGNV
jgi:pyruvate formate lyase activating enzyme